MSILPWLTIGANLLGGFLGSNNSQNTSSNTNSSTKENQTGATAQAGETKATGTQTGTQNQQGSTTQNQSQQTRTDSFGNQISEQLAESIAKTTGQQVGTVNRLDDATKALLTTQVQGMLRSSTGSNDVLSQEIARLSSTDPNFDAEAYVAGVMGAAESDLRYGVQSDLGRMRDEAGVSGASNSAAKLLESRVLNDASKTLGGIRSQAQAEAARLKTGMDESRVNQLLAATGGQNQQLQQSLQSLLGATQMESTTNTSTNTGSQSTKGNTKETSGSTGNTSTNTTGTSDTKTQTSQTETQNQQQRQTATTKNEANSNTNQSSTGSTTDTKGGGWSGLLEAFTGMLKADW